MKFRQPRVQPRDELVKLCRSRLASEKSALQSRVQEPQDEEERGSSVAEVRFSPVQGHFFVDRGLD